MAIVDPSSGRVNLKETDFKLPGLMPLVFERSYRSTNIWAGELGFGWASSFGVQLWAEEKGAKLVFRGTDGRRAFLPAPTGGQPSENETMRVSVELLPRETLPWPQLRTGLALGVYMVQAAGLPTLLFDARVGSRQTFPLCGMADRSGNLIQIFPTAAGLPGRVDILHGRTLDFVRDEFGRMQEIRLLTKNAAPILLARYQYDKRGDLVGMQDTRGVRTYEYDSEHRLTIHRDRMGGAFEMVYDRQGRCIRSSEPGRTKQREYQYDTVHNRTTATDGLGHKVVFEYGPNETIVRVTDQDGGVSLFDYDAQSRLVRSTNQLGKETTICFGANGAPAGKVSPNGAVSGVITNDRGETDKIISGTGATTEYKRDELGRVVELTRPSYGTCKLVYGPQGEISGVTTPSGKTAAFKRSDDYRVLTVSDDEGLIAEQHSDEVGRVVSFRDANKTVTQYSYDPAGNLSEITYPDQTRRRYVYDGEKRLIELTDEAGRTTRWKHDAGGRCIEVTRPDGKRIRSAYDSENRLISVAEPSGLAHTFAYTPRGLLAQQTTTDGRTLKYKHDAAGAIIAATDADGSVTAAQRDAGGYIQETQYSDQSIKKCENRCDGRWLRVELNGHRISRELSPEGYALREHQDDFRLQREFDKTGRPASVTDSFGRRVAYSYNPDEQVSKLEITQGHWAGDEWIADGPPRTHTFEYDRMANLVEWKMPSGKRELRKYDPRQRLIEQKVMLRDQVIVSRTYAYDPSGRANRIDDSLRGLKEINLDVLGRITACRQGQNAQSFGYSATDDLATGIVCSPGHRVRSAKEADLQYDARGFVIRRLGVDGRADEFNYLPQGLLREARLADGKHVAYDYDPHLRLVSVKNDSWQARYFWDDDTLWALQEDNSPAVTFTTIPGALSPLEQSRENQCYSVHVDHCDKIQELIDDDGRVVWRNQEGVWGEGRRYNTEIVPGAECPFGFPGQIWDKFTGFYYNRYRYYNPAAAHYLTPDPVGIYGGLDPYRYVADPVNLIDPLGLACRGKTDDSTLYRGDSRPPSEICANGFQPSNPSANLSLFQHVEGVPSTGSNWISTTYEGGTAERFAKSGVSSSKAPPNAEPWVYVIDNPGCGVEVDCDPEVQKKYGNSASEEEIAFNGGVPAKNVVGYYNVNAGAHTFQACP